MRRKSITYIAVLFLWIGIMLNTQVYAKDLGKIGTVYPIAESDLREVLRDRAAALTSNGKLIEMQNTFQSSIKKAMDRPQPIEGLTETLTPRTFIFDPAVNVTRDIRGGNNTLLVSQGTRVNALQNNATGFPPLLFYNADSAAQSRWARQEDTKLHGRDLLILVGGSVFSQIKAFSKPVYFDQGGVLINRLGISHVPAIVIQQGKNLLIQEVSPE